MNVSIKKSLLLGLFSLLAACESSSNDESTKIRQLAISNARCMKAKMHEEYLSCYALNQENKPACTTKLAEKYIAGEWKNHQEYKKAFQFEAEKLGFKSFIVNNNLLCEQIESGPEFDYSTNSYIVKCKSNNNVNFNQYLVYYDYDRKEWYLKK